MSPTHFPKASTSGDVIVGFYLALAAPTDFFLKKETLQFSMLPFQVLTTPSSEGSTIVARVGTYTASAGQIHGFLYEQGDFKPVDVPFPDVSGNRACRDYSNNSGQIAGFYVGPTGEHGFLFERGKFFATDVSFSGALATPLAALNDLGEIIGTYDRQRGQEFSFLATPAHQGSGSRPDTQERDDDIPEP